jgi:putative transposase
MFERARFSVSVTLFIGNRRAAQSPSLPRPRGHDEAADLGHQFQIAVAGLWSAFRPHADARPTYGHRRIAALLKRKRRADGTAPVNTKRVYRLTKMHGLLLARHTGRRRPREHDGQVARLRSNIRWCSDGL